MTSPSECTSYDKVDANLREETLRRRWETRTNVGVECRVQSVLFHSDCARGLRSRPSSGGPAMVNPKCAYFGRICSLDILYYPIFRSPLLMSNIQVNFGNILPKTSKSSAFWDMGVDSHLKCLLLFSLGEACESKDMQETSW